MSAPATSGVEVSPGTGWVARRPGALLWSPAADRPGALLQAFLGAPDADSARTAVTRAVVDAAFDVAPFTLVTWSPSLHVVVLGALDVQTDAPSLPSLSGSTSTTWVEHRVPGPPDAVVIAGEPPEDGTDLAGGVARAGGFRLTARPEDTTPGAPAATGDAVPEEAAGGDEPEIEPDDPPRPPDGGAALLDQITGGDWMDDSIGLSWPRQQYEAELEAEPDLLPPPEPAIGAAHATVLARRCRSGHANPPDRAVCRRCGGLIDLGGPVVEVPRPVFAELVTDDGAAVPIAGTIVVGRNPDLAAARIDIDAERCVLPDRPGVSRTHVVIEVDGWRITATDCGSRRGTELVRETGEPARLEPWARQEVVAGDVLRLGGSTSIRLAEPGGTIG